MTERRLEGKRGARRTGWRPAVTLLAAALALAPAATPVGAQDRAAARPAERDTFVTRQGNRLMLGGKPFRFGGANVDWLGLASHSYYRPDVFYPAPEEVDDALATVVEMGGTVVRSHTLGINVGCPQCLQPAKGVVNEAAFRRMDYALKSAAEHGLKVLIPLVDAVGSNCKRRSDGIFPDAFYYGNTCDYLDWAGENERDKFHTSEATQREFRAYVALILNRVNSYTGVAYKDDPTILGWETCNSCSIRGNPADVAKWVGDIASYIKSIDRNHLVVDGSGLLRLSAFGSLKSYAPPADVDVLCSQYYPYWGRALEGVLPMDLGMGPDAISRHADAAAAHDRPYLACEFGWDAANFQLKEDLAGFLNAARRNPNIAGALFWNLEAHAADHGWMPVHGPAKPGLHAPGEDLMPGGDWWAFYYTGRNTRWNKASDMYARGQLLRGFAYGMSGRAVPPLAIPAAPAITSIRNGLVRWRGSVGAGSYSVELARSANGPWTAGCDRCATDETGQWQDPGVSPKPVWYRVVPFNPDGKAGTPSPAVQGKGS